MDCSYTVEWWTDAACPQEYLSIHDQCSLNLQSHGINIDLSPLTKTAQGTTWLTMKTVLLYSCQGSSASCSAFDNCVHG